MSLGSAHHWHGMAHWHWHWHCPAPAGLKETRALVRRRPVQPRPGRVRTGMKHVKGIEYNGVRVVDDHQWVWVWVDGVHRTHKGVMDCL